MMRLEFLLEEKSMEKLLKNLLPKILPEGYELGVNYFLRPHEGRNDLQKSIPRKIKGYLGHPDPIVFIVLHDQHSADCKELKRQLVDFFPKSGNCHYLVRIVCKELESWLLGDLVAIQKAYPRFKPGKYANKSRFRNPDSINAADELSKILPGFQKTGSAEAISLHMSVEDNKSPSFKQFVSGLEKVFEAFPGAHTT